MDKKADLGTAPIGKLLFRLAIPTVVAQLINMLYNIVDRIYIGRIPEVGSLALTGVGVCMPLIMIVSAFAALVGIAFTTGREFAEFSSRMHLIVWLLGICAMAAMGRIGLCRLTGKKPHFLLSAVFCIYCALRMVSRYQLWSSDPQLQDYFFYLGAYMALMLAAYHHAALDEGAGRHRSLWFFSLMAVYLCNLSLRGGMDTLLLLGCGAWAFTNLPRLPRTEE